MFSAISYRITEIGINIMGWCSVVHHYKVTVAYFLGN